MHKVINFILHQVFSLITKHVLVRMTNMWHLGKNLVLGTCSQAGCLVCSHCYTTEWLSSRFHVSLAPCRDVPSLLGHLRCHQSPVLRKLHWTLGGLLSGPDKKQYLWPHSCPLQDSLHKCGQVSLLLRASSKLSRNQFKIIYETFSETVVALSKRKQSHI